MLTLFIGTYPIRHEPFPRSACCSFIPLQISPWLGSFSNDDGDGNGNENAKIAMGLLSKTTTFHVRHAFLYISLPSLHDYHMKMPDFTLYGGRNQATTNFSFFF